jgi:hypothetical protein
MRSPQDEMVRGIQKALASLHQVSGIFSRWSVPAVCGASAGSDSAPRDTDSGSSSSATPVSQSDRQTNNDDEPRQGRKNPHSRGRKNACGPSTRTSGSERKQKLKNRYLACPFQKEEIVHNRHTTCRYAGADSMSTLRMHLAGQQHRGLLPFIDLCSSCKEYVISRSMWDSIHIMGRCIPGCDKPRVQVRNSPSNNSRVGAQWLRLFESIFPTSQKLPSPCEFRISPTTVAFTDVITTDVHDSSWIPKPTLRDFEHTEIIASTEFPLFNLDSLTAVTAQQDESAQSSSRERIASNVVIHVEIERSAVLESFSAGPRFQNLRHTQATSSNLSFLDVPEGAVDHTWRQTSDVGPPSHVRSDSTEVRHADAPEIDDNYEGFDFYFATQGTSDDFSSPHRQTIAPSRDINAQTGTDMQLQHHDNSDDFAQRAWLLYVLNQVERLTRLSDPEDEHANDQRIARINAMTPEQVHALSDTLVASVGQLRTTAPVSEVRTSLPTASADATASRTVVPEVDIEAPGPSHLDQAFPNPFAQVEWDDTELLDWNSGPDPTTRSFFPEDLLVTT